MALNLETIATDVASRLGIDETAALISVTAAVDYIKADTGAADDDLSDDDPRLTGYGVPLLAMRMYQDSPIPGAVSDFDPTYTGQRVPRVLYTHLEEYWNHLRVNFGIA